MIKSRSISELHYKKNGELLLPQIKYRTSKVMRFDFSDLYTDGIKMGSKWEELHFFNGKYLFAGNSPMTFDDMGFEFLARRSPLRNSLSPSLPGYRAAHSLLREYKSKYANYPYLLIPDEELDDLDHLERCIDDCTKKMKSILDIIYKRISAYYKERICISQDYTGTPIKILSLNHSKSLTKRPIAIISGCHGIWHGKNWDKKGTRRFADPNIILADMEVFDNYSIHKKKDGVYGKYYYAHSAPKNSFQSRLRVYDNKDINKERFEKMILNAKLHVIYTTCSGRNDEVLRNCLKLPPVISYENNYDKSFRPSTQHIWVPAEMPPLQRSSSVWRR